MDYEKEYKEAIARIQKYTKDEYGCIRLKPEDIFPELKESEDEKIRKEIYNALRYLETELSWDALGRVDILDAYAWLEKQGEQKPKFRVGDIIKCKYDDRRFTIKSVDLDKRTYTYTQEGCGNDIDYADEMFELVEQKPAWSEEDEKMLDTLIADYKFLSKEFRDKEHNFFVGMSLVKEDLDMINWLKSLKDRVQPQPKQEWSEEDEKKLLCVCAWIKDYPRIADFKDEMYTVANNYINWLKSLRPQWKPNEEMLDALYRAIPKNVMEISEDEMLLDKLYQGLKYGRVLSEK